VLVDEFQTIALQIYQ